MSTTALIIRPADAPSIHVLECDGPRKKFTQSRYGHYRLFTDNQPTCETAYCDFGYVPDSRLKNWGEPYWQIHQLHDGSVEIHACRPTHQEAMRGDLHGRWGSVIHLGHQPTRDQIRIGLQLARILCRCIPTAGFCISPKLIFFVRRIETLIPIKSSTGVRFNQPPSLHAS